MSSHTAPEIRRPERSHQLHNCPAPGMTYEMMRNYERRQDYEAGLRDLNPSLNPRQPTMVPRHSRPSYFSRYRRVIICSSIEVAIVLILIIALSIHAAPCTGFGCRGLAVQDQKWTCELSTPAGKSRPILHKLYCHLGEMSRVNEPATQKNKNKNKNKIQKSP